MRKTLVTIMLALVILTAFMGTNTASAAEQPFSGAENTQQCSANSKAEIAAVLAADQEPPPAGADAIGLGCVCKNFNDRLWDCCDDAYWYEGNPGWLECNGNWYWEWYLPYGCDPWD